MHSEIPIDTVSARNGHTPSIEKTNCSDKKGVHVKSKYRYAKKDETNIRELIQNDIIVVKMMK
jgi:hypothetical protein